MEKLYVVDTNALLDTPEIVSKYSCVILADVIRELEKHKLSNNRELAFNARRATRYIDDNIHTIKIDLNDYRVNDDRFDNDYVDNRILQACKENREYGLLTNDLLLKHKAIGLGIVTIENNSKPDKEYTGVHEIYITSNSEDQKLLASLYENPYSVPLDIKLNEYLYIWNKDKPTFNNEGIQNGHEFIDNFRFDGEKLVKLKYKPVYSKFTGEKVKPINKKQEMLFDLLQSQNQTIKSCFGKYGVGKDYVMITHALDLIEQGKMDKLIWARNNVELADVPSLGILPGDKNDKLMEFAMPLADHVGGIDGLEMLIRQNKIEIQHLGSLRGRDIKRSIIYVTECQNNTREHFKLLIGRVGEDSELWLNGDLNQTDSEVFKRNSGIRALSGLRGNYLFGQVTLDKTERSDTAKLAELI